MAPSLHWPRRRSEARLGSRAPAIQWRKAMTENPVSSWAWAKVLPLSFRNASILIHITNNLFLFI